MHLSAVPNLGYNLPPPEARRQDLCGDQAIPFTAALCNVNFARGILELTLQMNNLLSFPPEASCVSSKLHFSPHTSCL